MQPSQAASVALVVGRTVSVRLARSCILSKRVNVAMRCISAAYVVMRYLSVWPSVCLSRSWFMSKRIRISSKFFHHRVATPLWFFRAKRHSNIPTWTPLTGESNADWVGRNRDSDPLSGLTASVNAATGYSRCCKRGRRLTTATVSQVMTHRW